MDDFYAILGISPDSTEEEIRSAYLKKAKELHPDTSQKETEKAESDFKELNNAYLVIMEARGNKNKNDLENNSRKKGEMEKPYKSWNTSQLDPFQIFDRIISEILSDGTRRRNNRFHSPQRRKANSKRKNKRGLSSCTHNQDGFTICLRCR